MLNQTRALFNSYTSRIALLNSVPDVTTKFSVDPTVAQTLEQKVQESSEFLSLIGFELVVQQEGEKVGIGITGTVSGRTDTSAGGERDGSDPTDTAGRTYRCEQTNRDTALRYARLDAWAHKPDFQTIVRDLIVQRKALDRILIGWNGTHVAATTNKAQNPLLQDVNKGWIQNLRDQAAEQIMSHGSVDDAHIYVDVAGTAADPATADYVNLDALAFDLIQLLDPWHRQRTDLVVICSDELVHDKYFQIVNTAGNDAEKQIARDVLLLDKKIGGKRAVVVPGFPAGMMAITTFKNLAVYVQQGTQRRAIVDQPSRDRVVDFDSSNEAFVVEDNGLMAVAENIVLAAKAA